MASPRRATAPSTRSRNGRNDDRRGSSGPAPAAYLRALVLLLRRELLTVRGFRATVPVVRLVVREVLEVARVAGLVVRAEPEITRRPLFTAFFIVDFMVDFALLPIPVPVLLPVRVPVFRVLLVLRRVVALAMFGSSFRRRVSIHLHVGHSGRLTLRVVQEPHDCVRPEPCDCT